MMFTVAKHPRLSALLALACLALCGEAARAAGGEIRIQEAQGRVEVSPAGAATWVLTQAGQVLHPFDRLRTGPDSRATLLWSDQSVVPFGASTEIEILPPHDPAAASGLNLIKGILSFFHRDRPGRIRVITRGAAAGVEGTEFVIESGEVNGVERTRLSLIDGTVRFSNERGALILTNGQEAIAETGKAPLMTAGFVANNVLQWCFYYPAVLDLNDLRLTPVEEAALAGSLEAYRSGDLLQALAQYPAERQPATDSERLYRAALWLAVGQIGKSEAALAEAAGGDGDRFQRLSSALRTLIAAVKRQPAAASSNLGIPTGSLAASYYEQSQATDDNSLRTALELARKAANASTNFSFAWTRVAELEFGFGRIAAAMDALDRSLAIAPRNAQALALKGFLLAGRNRPREAMDWFDRALEVDAALGNAWLGRGLCRIRRGDNAGREDLLVAAALEPQRALLRSYLGKAYANAFDRDRAGHELDLAKRLDPSDPTAWLYSALLREQDHQINEGITDLEKSQELNQNRRLYRSQLLLDQDRAVRSTSLAQLYEKAGMREVSVREAARAVSYDYGNYSAHLFLSDSFNALRDPTRFNLRNETAWFNELLLANLLSPVGGTPLSQNISQQEYARLFERDRVGLSSSTEYRSDGQVRELVSQFGTIGNTSWALDLDYQHNDGIRPNNELDRIEWYTTLKHQITAQDSVLLQMKYQDYHSGDNFQYYDPTNARPHFRFDEFQSPLAVGGYHREWGPGVHSLVLAGRLENEQRFSDRQAPQAIVYRDTQILPPPPVVFVTSDQFDVSHRSELEIYTAEAQQIFENDRHALVLGGRWQGGEFNTRSQLSNPAAFTNEFPATGMDVRAVGDFERASAYAYETLKLPGRLLLTAGLAYEHMQFPENFRSPPVQSGEETRERWNPKAAVVWDALPEATVRGAYSQSLGGVSFDESYRLEPSQLGGFSQAFRTLIPESLFGSVAAPDHEVWGGALDLKFKTRTYVGLQGEWLRSDVKQTVGALDYRFAEPLPNIYPGSLRQHLDYDERAITVTVNQLLGDEWAAGAQYSFVRSELESRFPSLSQALTEVDSVNRAELQRVRLSLLRNLPSGFFAQGQWEWYSQINLGSASALPDDSFQQLNLFVGYRFPRQHGDITLGVLNVTGEDYRLNPVTPYAELPREAVFYARLRFRF
jgi:outer membrane receptor protein involved in Fe transport